MGHRENLELLRRYFDEVWTGGNIAAVRSFLAPDYRRHVSPTQPPLERDGQMSTLIAFRAAFPDITLTLEEAGADDDHVWFRSTMRGTHRGEILGIAATGRTVTVALLDLWRVRDGRVVEQWGGPDRLDLARQLGAQLVPVG